MSKYLFRVVSCCALVLIVVITTGYVTDRNRHVAVHQYPHVVQRTQNTANDNRNDNRTSVVDDLNRTNTAELSPTPATTGDQRQCINDFVARYEAYCNKHLFPKESNIPDRWRSVIKSSSSPASVNRSALCPCVPRQLR